MMRTNRTRTVVATALFALVGTACSGTVDGRVAGPSYATPDPATATATAIDLDDVLAVSRDGVQVAFVEDGEKICVRLRVPSGARGSTATCAQDVPVGRATRASFSPDGSRLVVFQDARQTGTRSDSGWIVGTGSGTAVRIDLPPAPDSGDAADPSGSTPSRTSSGPAGFADPVAAFLWQSDDTLIGIAVSATVYRVTASTGVGMIAASVGERGKDGVVMAALGGGTLVLVLDRAGGGNRLVAVALDEGTVRDLVVELGPDTERPTLMGVSPDGSKLLLNTADLVRFVPGQTAVYDLGTGARTVLPDTDRTFAVAGGFSPDGSLVALVGTDPIAQGDRYTGSDNPFTLRLAPADGSAAPRTVAAADSQTAYGPLYWSTSGWLTGAAYATPDPPGWTIGG